MSAAPDLAEASVSPWRRIVGDAVRFDRRGVRVVPAARMALGVTVALVVGYQVRSWATGAAAAGGALAVGIASVIPAPRPRLALLTSVAICMALGTFVGGATSSHPAIHIVIGAAVAFCCGLLIAVEPGLTSVGLNTLVAFLVYGRFAGSAPTAARTAGVVAAGAAGQLLLAVVAHHAPVNRALSGLARAYAALADFAADLDPGRSSLPAAQAIDVAGTDLEYSLATATANEALASVMNEARRIRLELLSLASAFGSADSGPDDAVPAPLLAVRECVSAFLRCIAEGLGQAAVPAGLEATLGDAERSLKQLTGASAATESNAGGWPIRADVASRALAGQLRAVAGLLPEAVSASAPPLQTGLALRSAARVSRRGAHGLGQLTHRLVANLTPRSDGLQHALRLAAVVTLATAITDVSKFGRGYWVALTAVLVLRPDFSTTFTRGVARAAGTLIGVGVATTIAVLANPHGWALVGIVAVAAWASAAVISASYAVFSATITALVVFLLAGIDQHPVVAGRERLVATVVGAGIALLAYAAWPAWGNERAADALADLAATTREYVLGVLTSCLDASSELSGAQLAARSRAVRLARTNAEAAVDRSLADPGSRQIDARTASSLLAALRRLSIAAHSLRLRHPPPRPLTASARQLIDAFDLELAGALAALRFGRVTKVHAPLRDLHEKFAEGIASELAERPGLDAVLAETDELVDATNSLTAVVSRAQELHGDAMPWGVVASRNTDN